VSEHTAAPDTPLGRLRSWYGCLGKNPAQCHFSRSGPVTAIRLPRDDGSYSLCWPDIVGSLPGRGSGPACGGCAAARAPVVACCENLSLGHILSVLSKLELEREEKLCVFVNRVPTQCDRRGHTEGSQEPSPYISAVSPAVMIVHSHRRVRY